MGRTFRTRSIAALVLALGAMAWLPPLDWGAPPDTIARKIQISFGMELQENALGQVLIVGITPGSPAALKGLRADDVILGVNKVTVVSVREVAAILDKVAPGKGAEFQISRDGRDFIVMLTVPTPAVQKAEKERAPLPDKRAAAFGMVLLEDGSGQALVSKVSLNSPAFQAGIREGDFVVALGGEEAASFADLLSRAIEIVDHERPGTEVAVGILRGDKPQTVSLVLPETLPFLRRMALPREGARMPSVRTAVARLQPLASQQATKMPQPIGGLVTFRRDPEAVEVYAEIQGLPPGRYRLVIHEWGDTGDLEKTAGGVYAPGPAAPAPAQAVLVQPGNLGDIEAGADGRAVLKRQVENLILDGPNSIIGRVLILHAETEPAPGSLGPMVAYGVIGVGHPLR